MNINKQTMKLVEAERIAQYKKWGDQASLPPLFLLGILGEELGEVFEAFNTSPGNPKARKRFNEELIQLAAVAVQWLEIRQGLKTKSILSLVDNGMNRAFIMASFGSPVDWLCGIGAAFGRLSKNLIEDEGDPVVISQALIDIAALSCLYIGE